VSADSLALIPRCGVIIRTGSGTDNVPVAAATALGIVVANTPDAARDAVADHAVGLLFAALRRIALYDRSVRAGNWHTSAPWSIGQMHGRSLGLIGFGRIAQGVAQRMRGFELSIRAYDPQVPEATMSAHGAQAASLTSVLAHSDFVSIHCPLTDETFHLLGERELRLMKPTAILINTARGPVIDEPALIRALTEGWIRAAALDVLEQEPPAPDNPLLALDNVVITPHVAAYSEQFLQESWRLSVETVIALAQGYWPRSYVNADVRPRWRLTPPGH
jgi:D-3-phosphoglycerate dehydrogenase